MNKFLHVRTAYDKDGGDSHLVLVFGDYEKNFQCLPANSYIGNDKKILDAIESKKRYLAELKNQK